MKHIALVFASSLAVLTGCTQSTSEAEVEPATTEQGVSAQRFAIILDAPEISALGERFFLRRSDVACAVEAGPFSNGASFPVARLKLGGAGWDSAFNPTSVPESLATGNDLLPGPTRRCTAFVAAAAGADVIGFEKESCLATNCNATSRWTYKVSYWRFR